MLDDYTRAQRRQYLGSSDATAAIVGRSPWANAYDVWSEKTEKVDEARRPSTPAMETGTYLEPAVLSWAEDQLGTPFTRSVFRATSDGIRCANFDAVSFNPPALIEAKTAGLFSRSSGSPTEWGQPGTDDVPEYVLLQVHHQFAVANDQEDWPPMTEAFIPVLLGGVGLVMYRVVLNPVLCAALVERETRFWTITSSPTPHRPMCCRATTRSPDTSANPGRSVAVDAALVAAWRLAQSDSTAAKKRADAAQQQLLASMADAEIGTCDLGTVTYKPQTRAAYTVEAQTYRVARFTAARTTGKD